MTVTDHLTRGSASVGKAKMINHVVEARLQYLEHGLARHTATLEGAFIHATELPFKQSVIIAELLFFNQTESVIGVLSARFWAMNTRAVIAAFEVFRWAKDGNAKTAADANTRTSIASHSISMK